MVEHQVDVVEERVAVGAVGVVGGVGGAGGRGGIGSLPSQLSKIAQVATTRGRRLACGDPVARVGTGLATGRVRGVVGQTQHAAGQGCAQSQRSCVLFAIVVDPLCVVRLEMRLDSVDHDDRTSELEITLGREAAIAQGVVEMFGLTRVKQRPFVGFEGSDLEFGSRTRLGSITRDDIDDPANRPAARFECPGPACDLDLFDQRKADSRQIESAGQDAIGPDSIQGHHDLARRRSAYRDLRRIARTAEAPHADAFGLGQNVGEALVLCGEVVGEENLGRSAWNRRQAARSNAIDHHLFDVGILLRIMDRGFLLRRLVACHRFGHRGKRHDGRQSQQRDQRAGTHGSRRCRARAPAINATTPTASRWTVCGSGAVWRTPTASASNPPLGNAVA